MLIRFAMTVWRSTIDASAYVSDFSRRRTGSALGYLFWVCTTLAFFTLLPITLGMAVIAPSAADWTDQQVTVLREWYPDDLEITLENGTLRTNRPNPVVFDVPTEWHTGETLEKHAIVIDTSANVEDFNGYNTVVLITAKAIAAQDNNELKVWMLDEIEENVTITKNEVVSVTDAARAYAPMTPWLLGGLALAFALIFPWIVGGLAWLGNLFFLLWATLILILCSMIMGRGLTYGMLYRLGAFGVTGSLLLGFALRMLSMGGTAWLVTYAAFFVWMIVVLARFPKGKRPAPTAVPLPPVQTMKKSSSTRKSVTRATSTTQKSRAKK